MQRGMEAVTVLEKNKLKELRSNSYIHIIFVTLFALYLSAASLYFAGCTWGKEMILSYYKIPLIAILNTLPVVLLVYLVYFLSARVWVSTLVSSCSILGLTWVNYYKIQFRNDPLFFEDLSLISESRAMAERYDIVLTKEMKITLIFIIVLIVFSAVMFRKGIKSLWIRLAGTVVIVVLFFVGIKGIYSSAEVYQKTENIALINRWSGTQMYISKGFVYPFLNSIQYSIMEEPEGYSVKKAEEDFYNYEYSDIPEEKKVNVISIMLEAYNDFTKYPQIEYNVDVYEPLHSIQEQAYSGELVTNIFAAGTVDTERSFLTGYTQLPSLRKNTNSYPWYFKEQGYTVEGSHPCYEWFYNRQNINENLGFENYYFYENCYSDLADGEIASDAILFPDIVQKYEENKKTGKPYFNFSVTYQNHGPYSLKNEQDTEYVARKEEYTEEEFAILNNYFAGIYSTNQEIKKMIDYFSEENEPVVVIFFGDHNPWLGDDNSVYEALNINLDLGTQDGFYNYYDTPYVIWGNEEAKNVLQNELKGKGEKIGPYFLMNTFFKLAGYEGNEFMKISNELKAQIDVVHELYYKEDGELVTDLSKSNNELLKRYQKLEYYWMTNYREK